MNNANELFETSAFTTFQEMLTWCGHDELEDYIDDLFSKGMNNIAYACLKDWKEFQQECDEYRETLDSARI